MEVTKQFCAQKTPEQAQKEMEELTKKEIEKLHEHLKNNPRLLCINQEHSDHELSLTDSEEDSTYEPSESEDSEESDENDIKPKVHIHYKKTKDNEDRIRKDIMKAIKKDMAIENLEKKEYYKKMELNNLSLENTGLKLQIESLKTTCENQEKILNFIVKFLELKNIKYFDNIKEDQINCTTDLVKLANFLVEIEKRINLVDTQHKDLADELNQLVIHEKHIPIKELYTQLLIKNMSKHFHSYHKYKNLTNKQISELQTNILPVFTIFAFLCVFFGIVVKFFY